MQGYFYIGNTVGSSNWVSQPVAASGTQSFSGLPTDGRNLFVRLWCYNGAIWSFTDYTYRAASGGGQATSFTWPTAPQETSNGYLGACGDWPNVSGGCYWLTANGWRDAQPFMRHYNPDFAGYHVGGDWNWGSGAADAGLPVYAVANGVITSVQLNVSGWGNVVFVRHDTPWGVITSMYAHVDWMTSGPPVQGQTVSKGQQIAVIGNGGGLYPYHLHFELRLGTSTAVGSGYISNQNGTPPQGQIDPNAFISTHR